METRLSSRPPVEIEEVDAGVRVRARGDGVALRTVGAPPRARHASPQCRPASVGTLPVPPPSRGRWPEGPERGPSEKVDRAARSEAGRQCSRRRATFVVEIYPRLQGLARPQLCGCWPRSPSPALAGHLPPQGGGGGSRGDW